MEARDRLIILKVDFNDRKPHPPLLVNSGGTSFRHHCWIPQSLLNYH